MNQRSHIVLYRVNPNNPKAADQIMEKVQQFLWPLCKNQSTNISFHAAIIPPPVRLVGKNDFQVMLNFIFPNEEAYQWYMRHELHEKFVSFVLRGWMLKGDDVLDGAAHFINHILHALPNDPPAEWVRNPLVPENRVVWAGELVIDA